MPDSSAHGSRHPAPEQSENRARFQRLVGRPDPLIDLGEVCACIAEESAPGLGAERLGGELDAIAERVRAHLAEPLRGEAWPDAGIRTAGELAAILAALHRELYSELGLRGAPRDAWEPRHCFPGDVLELRRGLPISLGVIELEVGWRLGLPLFGIGLPGHFVVGGPDGLVLDPYHGGRRLTLEDCETLVLEATGRELAVSRGVMRPATRREIVARILGNLRGIYLSRREWGNAIWVLELLVLLEPHDPGLRRDRALLYGRAGRFSDAVRGLDRYLEEEPEAADAVEVRIARSIFGGRRN